MKNLQFKIALSIITLLSVYGLSLPAVHAANVCLIADCVNVDGWAQDLDVPNTAVDVEIYKDGPVGTGTLVGRVTADQPYTGYANHGFNFTIPSSLKTGNPVLLYLYSIGKNKSGSDDGDNAYIGTKTIQCGVVATTQCSDGVDNADPEDTLIDMADPGCSSPADDDETNVASTYDPEGFLDTANCDRFNGWAVDIDTPLSAIAVHFYVDGPAGTGTFLGAITANDSRPDVGNWFRTGHVPLAEIGDNHGYWYSTPNSVKDNNPHSIYAYGINNDSGGNNPLLIGSPTTITCAPPPLAPTVTIAATPASILAGGTSVLNWSSTNAASCIATDAGSWTGLKSITPGSESVSPLTTTNYTLTCYTGAGINASASALVTVTPGPTCTNPLATNNGGALPCTYPPGTCTNPLANNIGSPLPCTYPPGTCADPTANNVGAPLPCTYNPGLCSDQSADNLGSALPCTYPPGSKCLDSNATNVGSSMPCNYPPLSTCADSNATNVGLPLPCTYNPGQRCSIASANNFGQLLPCTYPPIVTDFIFSGIPGDTLPIKFIGSSGADSQPGTTTVNPFNGYDKDVTIQYISVANGVGSPLPVGTDLYVSFSSQAFVKAVPGTPSTVMTWNPAKPPAGQYVDSFGNIGLRIQVRVTKAITEKYFATFRATGSDGKTHDYIITIDPNSIKPIFKEE